MVRNMDKRPSGVAPAFNISDLRSASNVTIVCDNIRSALNVGSVFRSADAFGAAEIILCGITAQPPHKEILKTALGATMTVPWRFVPSVVDAIHVLRSQHTTIIGIEQTLQSLNMQEYPWTDRKYAVILGNELDGISDKVLPLLDACVEIPQFGSKKSLNVSVAAGIVLYDIVCKKRQQRSGE